MPCKPSFRVTRDKSGRLRYFQDGGEIDSRADYVNRYRDYFGEEPKLPNERPDDRCIGAHQGFDILAGLWRCFLRQTLDRSTLPLGRELLLSPPTAGIAVLRLGALARD